MSPRKITNGLFLMGIGIILLLNNFNILDWSVWFRLIQLWPVLLITAGIGLIFKDNYLGLLGPALLVVTLIYAAATPPDRWKGWDGPFVIYSDNDIRDTEYSRPVGPDIRAAEINIQFGAGKLDIKGGSDKLYDADLEYSFRRPYEEFIVRDGVASARLSLRGRIPIGRSGRAQRWDIRLTDRVPVAIDIDAGACSTDLDLSDVKLESLDIDCGASSISAALGVPERVTEVRLDAGASSISMTIPRGVAVKVEVDSALSSNSFDGMGLVKDGQVWYSQNYETAKAKYDIYCSNGVGSFSLRYTDMGGRV